MNSFGSTTASPPPNLTSAILRRIMQVTIDEAKKATAEDDRTHPKVGAALVDLKGEILVTAHRGEVPKDHAEFTLLNKAAKQHLFLGDKYLFTTLEPCTARGPGKIPCAQRIVAAGVGRVYVGILDPNPQITGRGETYLSYSTAVDRYPGDLADEIRHINKDFLDSHRQAHVPQPSLYLAPSPTDEPWPKPRLTDDRNMRLQQTLDMMSAASSDVWIMSGRKISWLRDAALSLLFAALEKREIKLLTFPAKSVQDQSNRAIARSLGVAVGESSDRSSLRGTLADPSIRWSTSMVLIDQGSATFLRSPEDEGLLEILRDYFQNRWENSFISDAAEPAVHDVPESSLIDALRSGVPQYANATFDLRQIDPVASVPLTLYLERFKLFRLTQLEAMRTKHGIPAAATVSGSPWPVTPPVLELRDDGRLIVLDGTHRVFSALSRGVTQLEAVVVKGCSAQLPARPLESWDSVRVFNTKVPRGNRYDGYRSQYFRPIKKSFTALASF